MAKTWHIPQIEMPADYLRDFLEIRYLNYSLALLALMHKSFNRTHQYKAVMISIENLMIIYANYLYDYNGHGL